MTVPRLLDRLGAAVTSAVPTGTSVGIAAPSRAADLPAVVLHARALVRSITGVGGRPAPSRTGALPVDHEIDLADPVLTFLDGTSATLVSDDRLTVFLPFGPAVAADGTEVAVLEAGDVDIVLDGAPLPVVTTAPGAGQARCRPLLGVVDLGTPLSAVGTLTLAYHIGEWEVSADRFAGELVVDVWDDATANIDDLSRAVDLALIPAPRAGIDELKSIAPIEFGEIAAPDGSAGNGRRRRLVYRIDAEIEDLLLGGGGGPIRTVDVTSDLGPAASPMPEGLEQFSVPVR